LFYYLHEWMDVFSPLRVFQYITVRGFGAAATSFVMCLAVGPTLIKYLQRRKIGQHVRTATDHVAAPQHAPKQGTPTMGGLLIIVAVLVSVLLWARPDNAFVWIALATMCFMGGVGLCDDVLKQKGANATGLRARYKLIMQAVWAAIMVVLLVNLPATRSSASQLMAPFAKDPLVQDMGIFFTFLFVAIVLLGATNAVNLTDGVDGLAIGCSASVALSYLALAYVSGHAVLAGYLLVPYLAGSGELAVFCGALLGACLGFLWFNCHPARIFMGDTGSLALGGSIAAVAILIKQELLLVIVGGVFVVEALSVIVQVISFRLTGRRVFAMAPIHHHFELKDWSETQVTVRFWILSIIFALLGLLTLKIR
jgi:phospho-N-acetylmuramoyl-pentapeptide-transferase